VTLTSHGGPGRPPVSAATATNVTDFTLPGGHEVNFSVVKGVTYSWQVTTPTGYRATGGHGTFTAGNRDVNKTVKYRPYTATVMFYEHGLPAHTTWTIYVNETTAPFTNEVLSGVGTLKAFLQNGTYSYTVLQASGRAPTPAAGTVTVTAPHALSINVHFGAAGPASPSVGPTATSRSVGPPVAAGVRAG